MHEYHCWNRLCPLSKNLTAITSLAALAAKFSLGRKSQDSEEGKEAGRREGKNNLLKKGKKNQTE